MYKFQGAQQYRHPDHVIRKSHKTERYSDTGKKIQNFDISYVFCSKIAQKLTTSNKDQTVISLFSYASIVEDDQ